MAFCAPIAVVDDAYEPELEQQAQRVEQHKDVDPDGLFGGQGHRALARVVLEGSRVEQPVIFEKLVN
jgi:hypothetical protein